MRNIHNIVILLVSKINIRFTFHDSLDVRNIGVFLAFENGVDFFEGFAFRFDPEYDLKMLARERED